MRVRSAAGSQSFNAVSPMPPPAMCFPVCQRLPCAVACPILTPTPHPPPTHLYAPPSAAFPRVPPPPARALTPPTLPPPQHIHTHVPHALFAPRSPPSSSLRPRRWSLVTARPWIVAAHPSDYHCGLGMLVRRLGSPFTLTCKHPSFKPCTAITWWATGLCPGALEYRRCLMCPCRFPL
jgi:hypothetical protein